MLLNNHSGCDVLPGRYSGRLVNGKYSKPENVGETINTELSESAPFIAPDESYLIFGKEAQGDRTVKSGLYIAFRDADGKWTKPTYMGDEINSGGAASPYVSPDGRYLFFNSGRNGNYDVYWADAKIISDLKPGELK
jgi:Tol biopolymer transport system component